MATGTTPRLAVLASGRGSNLQAILDAVADGRLGARVAGVFGDRPRAQALERARAVGIEARGLRPRDFTSRDDFDLALFTAAASVEPDFIVCAGYMRLIGAAAIAPWHGRIINIHPSLLPEFKGLDTHARALEAGVAEHGASVHFVTSDLDGGPVIAQARVPVLAGDDPDTLAERVLEVEHPLMVAALQLLCAGRITLRDATVELDGRGLEAPLQLASNRLTA